MEPAKTLDELAERLSEVETARVRAFFAARLTREQAVCDSVSGSTFRAYRTQKYTPSSLFRSWALEVLGSRKWASRLAWAARTDDNYRRFHACLNRRLEAHWRAKDGSDLSFAQSRKLTDLLMKHVMLAEADHECTDELRASICTRINVPLDKYTLKHLSGVARCVGIEIPKNASMGWTTEENYERLQGLVRQAATLAGVAPITFDIYAWNAEHAHIGDPAPDERRDLYAARCKLQKRRTKRPTRRA